MELWTLINTLQIILLIVIPSERPFLQVKFDFFLLIWHMDEVLSFVSKKLGEDRYIAHYLFSWLKTCFNFND